MSVLPRTVHLRVASRLRATSTTLHAATPSWGATVRDKLAPALSGPAQTRTLVLAALLSSVLGTVLLQGSASAATPPKVTMVRPDLGPGSGGTKVLIRGSNLTGAVHVDFGSTPAASFAVAGAAPIGAIAPAVLGTVDVTVTTPGGTSTATSADQFHYLPLVTGVSPDSGPVDGGTVVTITGVDFTGATAVFFGSAPASDVTVNSNQSITAVAPPTAAAGKVRVTVTTAQGTSPLSREDAFKYRPTVTSVSPDSGPAAGGVQVTVSGTGFAVGMTGTSITFGPAVAKSVSCATTTECSATLPAAPPKVIGATVDVRAKVHSVFSERSSADSFTYGKLAPPTVVAEEAAAGLTRATLRATVNPNGSQVEECYFEYFGGRTGGTVPCNPLPGSGETPEKVSAVIGGSGREALLPETSYLFYIVACNTAGCSYTEGSFTTESEPPEPLTLYTGGGYALTGTSAELSGYIEWYGEGGGGEHSKQEVSECYFELREPSGGWLEVPCAPEPGSVYAIATELTPATEYEVRLVAGNLSGTYYGRYESFSTPAYFPPTVELEEASSLTETSARLNGAVNPGGVAVTACYFEWGTTTNYGNTVACSALPGSGSDPVAVSASVAGLDPATPYHFRLVATNGEGTEYSPDGTFTTPSP